MFPAALFTTVKTWRQPKCPTVDEWMKMWRVCVCTHPFTYILYMCNGILLSHSKLMLSNCGAGECSWESLGQRGEQISQSWRKSTLNIHCKDWCWTWSSSTLATWCEELTHWERPWGWERLSAGGEGGYRGWDGWIASPTQWTWIWANSRRCERQDRENWRAAVHGVANSLT